MTPSWHIGGATTSQIGSLLASTPLTWVSSLNWCVVAPQWRGSGLRWRCDGAVMAPLEPRVWHQQARATSYFDRRRVRRRARCRLTDVRAHRREGRSCRGGWCLCRTGPLRTVRAACGPLRLGVSQAPPDPGSRGFDARQSVRQEGGPRSYGFRWLNPTSKRSTETICWPSLRAVSSRSRFATFSLSRMVCSSSHSVSDLAFPAARSTR
jgi:hypothetical protein